MRKIALQALLALFTATGSALADGSKLEAAKQAYGAGDRAYAAGENLAAARAYENAYELYPLPSITFSIAQAYRRHYEEDPDLYWLEKAQSLYRRYLVEQPSGGRRAHAITHLANIELLLAGRANEERAAEPKRAPQTELLISSATPHAMASVDGARPDEVPLVQRVKPGKHRVKLDAVGFFPTELDVLAVEDRLSIVPLDLKPRPASLRVDSNVDGARVAVDGQVVARTPIARAIEIPAGHHTVSVSARGDRPVSRSITIERGSAHTLRIDLEPSTQRVAAYWTFAGAGAFALAGGVTALLAVLAEHDAQEARSNLADGPALTPEQASKSNDALERRNRYRTLSILSFSVSAVSAVSGTLLFVFDDPVPSAPGRDTSRGFGIGYRGVF